MIFGRTPVTEALAFVDEELAWARERGLPALEADALLGGPYVYARLGRFDEARDRLERSKAICRELGIAYGLAEAHMAGAELEMLAGDPEAVESMAGTDDITAHAEVLLDLAEVLRLDGDRIGAQATLAEALALHEQKGNLVSVEWCRRLLAELQAGGSVPSGP